MNRIKFLREEKGVLQKDLAKLLNVTTPLINYYENEKRTISTKTASILADYFGVSLDYLLGKSAIRNPEEQILKDNNNLTVNEANQFNSLDVSGLDKKDIDEIQEQIDYKRWKKKNSNEKKSKLKDA